MSTEINGSHVSELDHTFIASTYGRLPVCLVRGEGSLVYDDQGKEYIDLGSGIGVTAFGIHDTTWSEAVIKQVNQLNHVSNLYYTSPQAELAKLLCEKTGMKKVFFCNSGAEANECAIKVARKYSSDKYGGSRNVIITLENSFHGRTLATLAATGQDVFHQHFGPFPEGFVHTPANDIEAFYETAKAHQACAIMMEAIQGEGGVMPLDAEFVQAVAAYAKEHDLVLIMDEVQTGNGRTGKIYGYEHFGIQPDVVSTAKGLAAGLPMGATLLGDKVKDVFQSGDHGSTFGGNPICAAGAKTVVERLTPALLAEVTEKGQYIKSVLAGKPGVLSVSGLGLMVGIETTASPKEVIAECLKQGVIVLSAKNKVRLLPALTITKGQLEKAMKVLIDVIGQLNEKA